MGCFSPVSVQKAKKAKKDLYINIEDEIEVWNDACLLNVRVLRR